VFFNSSLVRGHGFGLFDAAFGTRRRERGPFLALLVRHKSDGRKWTHGRCARRGGRFSSVEELVYPSECPALRCDSRPAVTAVDIAADLNSADQTG
jgi:hypothetical protein